MPVNDESASSLGSWNPAEMAVTARADAGLGADDGLPPTLRFVSNIAKLIRRRRAQPNAGSDPSAPAVFLLQSVAPEVGNGKPLDRVPMLDNGLTRVTGRVWFVGAMPASGRYVDIDVPDDDALIRFITDELRLGTTPAIVFDPRLPIAEARFYPKGVAELNHYELVSIGESEITVDHVFSAIESVYRSCLVTPEAQPAGSRLWRKQSKWWPSAKAEAIVQINLKAGLVAAFPTCTVRHEQSQPEGRLDLEIERSDPLDRSKVTRHAILELKVLRSFRESGSKVADQETRDWVESGVKQAATYRESKGAKWCAVCCFDMRTANTGDTCFAHVQQLAQSLSVILKRWFLYAKSKYYRDASTSAA